MGLPNIAPFDDSYLDAAAALLASRHRRDREREPALREHFATPEGARAAVATAWREKDASGVVALRDGQLAGFLIGAPDFAPIWGRSMWVRFGGHALADSEDADLYRDLYAAASPGWLARGCFAHYAEIPASAQARLDAWHKLGFGHQQAYGIRPLPATDLPAPPQNPAISIRRASPDDLATVAELEAVLWTHLGQAPVYSVRLPEDTAHWNEAADEALSDPRTFVWLAERDGAALGAVAIRPLATDDEQPDVPDGCCFLAFAATRREARGRGVSTALTIHALRAAHDAGYRACLTDWRVTNLPASRLWPHLGFRPFEYRLHRLIDDRIAWASGSSW